MALGQLIPHSGGRQTLDPSDNWSPVVSIGGIYWKIKV